MGTVVGLCKSVEPCFRSWYPWGAKLEVPLVTVRMDGLQNPGSLGHALHLSVAKGIFVY